MLIANVKTAFADNLTLFDDFLSCGYLTIVFCKIKSTAKCSAYNQILTT